MRASLFVGSILSLLSFSLAPYNSGAAPTTTALLLSPSGHQTTPGREVLATDLDVLTPANASQLVEVDFFKYTLAGPATAIAFNYPDGSILAAGFTDGAIQLWSPQTRDDPPTSNHPSARVNGLAFSPKTYDILISASNDTSSRLWWTTQDSLSPMDRPVLQTDVLNTNTAIAFSNTGAVIAVGKGNGAFALWSLATRARIDEITVTESSLPILDLTFNARNDLLALASTDGTFRLYDFSEELSKVTVSPRWTHPMDPVAAVTAARFHPVQGHLLAIGTSDGRVEIWDTHARQSLFSDEFPSDATAGVGFAPSGDLLAACNEDGELRVWDVATHATLFSTFKRPLAKSCAFSPDGTRLAVATSDGIVLYGVPAPTNTTEPPEAPTQPPTPITEATHTPPPSSQEQPSPPEETTPPNASTSQDSLPTFLVWLSAIAGILEGFWGPLLCLAGVLFALLVVGRIWWVQHKRPKEERRNPVELASGLYDELSRGSVWKAVKSFLDLAFPQQRPGEKGQAKDLPKEPTTEGNQGENEPKQPTSDTG